MISVKLDVLLFWMYPVQNVKHSFPDNFLYLGHPNKDSNMQVNFPKKSPQKNVHKIFN